MNRHTKLSAKQPYLSVNKIVYEETFEFDFFDLNSLKFWLIEIEKQEIGEKFNFQIETSKGKCSVKFFRFEKEEEKSSTEALEKILESRGYLIIKPVKPLETKKNEIKPLGVAQISEQFNLKKSLDNKYIPALTTNYLSNLMPSEFTYIHGNNTL